MKFPRPIRAHREHYANRGERFHLTMNAHAKFRAWPSEVRNMLLDSLFEQHKAGRIDLYAACVMPDHVHMLMAPVEKDVVEFANSWKSWTTRLSWRLGNRNALWQPGMWDRTIRDERDFNEVVEYIVANPMKSGLVESEQEWPHAWNWCQDEPPE